MTLNEAIDMFNQLISRHGVRGWTLRRVTTTNDAKRVLRNFGGMGSLRDLYISSMNGHRIHSGEELAINQELHRLLDCIYKRCHEMTQV